MIPQQKTALRSVASELRRALHAERGGAAAIALAQWAEPLVQMFAAHTIIAGYWPLGSELDPRPLMQALAALGLSLSLPVVVGRDQPLQFRCFQFGDELESGPMGTHHPARSAPLCVPNVVLVPLLAFDAQGYRLGYGGGYYDRTLTLLRQGGEVTTIGIGFAAQQVDHVPHDALDQRLDSMLTEHGMTRI